MAKKNENVKMNKYGYISIVLIIVAIVLSVLLLLPNSEEKFMDEWAESSLTTDNVYKKVDFDEFQKAIKSDKVVYVFYGTPSDSDSVTNISTYDANARLMDVEEILYLDSSSLTDSQYTTIRGYLTSLNQLDSATKVDIRSNDGIVVPDLWSFQSGKMVNSASRYSGTDLNAASISKIIFGK